MLIASGSTERAWENLQKHSAGAQINRVKDGCGQLSGTGKNALTDPNSGHSGISKAGGFELYEPLIDLTR